MSYFDQLASFAKKKERIILGLMSGTSIDGLDLALCRFSGFGEHVEYEVLNHKTCSYSKEQRDILRFLATEESVRMEDVCIYHTELSYWHALMVNKSLNEWGVKADEVDLISSHGQTIRHAPKRIHQKPNLANSTFQLGEPDHLARLTGIITISDLRQKHIAAGGEGAPLAVYGDHILFSDPDEYRILLNIGGIANLTVLDPDEHNRDLPLTFDTGPGNTLMDLFVRKYFAPMTYDAGGTLALQGAVIPQFLKALKFNEYFRQAPPKTTGPELLSENFLNEAMRNAGIDEFDPKDLLATLNRFTSDTIADSIEMFVKPSKDFVVYVSGGGAHNKLLMQNLAVRLHNARVADFSELGVHPDAKEALFFAALANELVCGQQLPVQKEDGSYTKTSLGKISLPD